MARKLKKSQAIGSQINWQGQVYEGAANLPMPDEVFESAEYRSFVADAADRLGLDYKQVYEGLVDIYERDPNNPQPGHPLFVQAGIKYASRFGQTEWKDKLGNYKTAYEHTFDALDTWRQSKMGKPYVTTSRWPDPQTGEYDEQFGEGLWNYYHDTGMRRQFMKTGFGRQPSAKDPLLENEIPIGNTAIPLNQLGFIAGLSVQGDSVEMGVTDPAKGVKRLKTPVGADQGLFAKPPVVTGLVRPQIGEPLTGNVLQSVMFINKGINPAGQARFDPVETGPLVAPSKATALLPSDVDLSQIDLQMGERIELGEHGSFSIAPGINASISSAQAFTPRTWGISPKGKLVIQGDAEFHGAVNLKFLGGKSGGAPTPGLSRSLSVDGKPLSGIAQMMDINEYAQAAAAISATWGADEWTKAVGGVPKEWEPGLAEKVWWHLYNSGQIKMVSVDQRMLVRTNGEYNPIFKSMMDAGLAQILPDTAYEEEGMQFADVRLTGAAYVGPALQTGRKSWEYRKDIVSSELMSKIELSDPERAAAIRRYSGQRRETIHSLMGAAAAAEGRAPHYPVTDIQDVIGKWSQVMAKAEEMSTRDIPFELKEGVTAYGVQANTMRALREVVGKAGIDINPSDIGLTGKRLILPPPGVAMSAMGGGSVKDQLFGALSAYPRFLEQVVASQMDPGNEELRAKAQATFDYLGNELRTNVSGPDLRREAGGFHNPRVGGRFRAASGFGPAEIFMPERELAQLMSQAWGNKDFGGDAWARDFKSPLEAARAYLQEAPNAPSLPDLNVRREPVNEASDVQQRLRILTANQAMNRIGDDISYEELMQMGIRVSELFGPANAGDWDDDTLMADLLPAFEGRKSMQELNNFIMQRVKRDLGGELDDIKKDIEEHPESPLEAVTNAMANIKMHKLSSVRESALDFEAGKSIMGPAYNTFFRILPMEMLRGTADSPTASRKAIEGYVDELVTKVGAPAYMKAQDAKQIDEAAMGLISMTGYNASTRGYLKRGVNRPAMVRDIIADSVSLVTDLGKSSGMSAGAQAMMLMRDVNSPAFQKLKDQITSGASHSDIVATLQGAAGGKGIEQTRNVISNSPYMRTIQALGLEKAARETPGYENQLDEWNYNLLEEGRTLRRYTQYASRGEHGIQVGSGDYVDQLQSMVKHGLITGAQVGDYEQQLKQMGVIPGGYSYSETAQNIFVPTTRDEASAFLRTVKGIGPKLAGAASEHFKENLPTVLSNFPDMLADVPKFGPARIQAVKDQYNRAFQGQFASGYVTNPATGEEIKGRVPSIGRLPTRAAGGAVPERQRAPVTVNPDMGDPFEMLRDIDFSSIDEIPFGDDLAVLGEAPPASSGGSGGTPPTPPSAGGGGGGNIPPKPPGGGRTTASAPSSDDNRGSGNTWGRAQQFLRRMTGYVAGTIEGVQTTQLENGQVMSRPYRVSAYPSEGQLDKLRARLSNPQELEQQAAIIARAQAKQDPTDRQEMSIASGAIGTLRDIKSVTGSLMRAFSFERHASMEYEEISAELKAAGVPDDQIGGFQAKYWEIKSEIDQDPIRSQAQALVDDAWIKLGLDTASSAQPNIESLQSFRLRGRHTPTQAQQKARQRAGETTSAMRVVDQVLAGRRYSDIDEVMDDLGGAIENPSLLGLVSNVALRQDLTQTQQGQLKSRLGVSAKSLPSRDAIDIENDLAQVTAQLVDARKKQVASAGKVSASELKLADELASNEALSRGGGLLKEAQGLGVLTDVLQSGAYDAWASESGGSVATALGKKGGRGKWSGTLDVLGGLMSPLGHERAMINRAWSYLGAPTFEQYIPAVAQQELQMAGIAAQVGGSMAGGMGTTGTSAGMALRQYQAARSSNMAAAGRAGFMAWGDLLGATESGEARAVQAIFGPPIGAGIGLGFGMTALAKIPALAALGPAAIPTGIAVATIGSAYATGEYFEGMAAGTPYNNIQAALQQDRINQGGIGGLWAGVMQQATGAARVGVPPIATSGMSLNQWQMQYQTRIAQSNLNAVQQGRALLNTPMRGQSFEERLGLFQSLSQQLFDSGQIQGFSVDQIASAMGHLATYSDSGDWTATNLQSAGMVERIQEMLLGGSDPASYSQLATSIGLRVGGAGALDSAIRNMNLPAAERQSYERALQQFSFMADFGRGPGEIMSYAQSTGELSQRGMYSLGRISAGDARFMTRAIYGQVSTDLPAELDLRGRYDAPHVERATGLQLGTTNWRELQQAALAIDPQMMRSGLTMISQSNLFAGLGTWRTEDLYKSRTRSLRDQQYAMSLQQHQAQYGAGPELGGFVGASIALDTRQRQLDWATTMGGTFGDVAFTGSFGFQAESMAMSYADSVKSLGLQARSMSEGLAYQRRQSAYQLENMDISRARENVTRGWQLEDMGLSQDQAAVDRSQQWALFGISQRQTAYQREWSTEDFAWQRQQSQQSFGWQMEDIDESLRYATGRQRKQLLKQRDRLVIQENQGMGRLDEQEDRQETLWDLEDERFEIQRKQLEEMEKRETENFSRQEERMRQRWEWEDQDFERSRTNLLEQIGHNERVAAIQQEQHANAVEQLEARHSLQLRQMAEQEEAYKLSYKMREEAASLEYERAMLSKRMAEDALEIEKQRNNLADDYEDKVTRTQRLQMLVNAGFEEFWTKLIENMNLNARAGGSSGTSGYPRIIAR